MHNVEQVIPRFLPLHQADEQLLLQNKISTYLFHQEQEVDKSEQDVSNHFDVSIPTVQISMYLQASVGFYCRP